MIREIKAHIEDKINQCEHLRKTDQENMFFYDAKKCGLETSIAIIEAFECIQKPHVKIYKCQQCICFNSWRNDDGELIYTCNVNGKKIDNPQEIADHCEEV